MYEVAFTTGFRDGLRDINASGSILNAIQRCVDTLRADPFQKIPNAKRLRGSQARFRIRLGDLRLLYRVDKRLDRIVLFAIGQRQGIYKKRAGSAILETSGQPLAKLLVRNGSRRRTKPTHPTTAPSPAPTAEVAMSPAATARIDIAPVGEWITDEELWLLHVAPEYREAILHASDAEAIPDSVPRDVQLRVESYVTSPVETQLGRVYALGNEGIHCITTRPLYEFLTSLDPEQERVIQSGLGNGPYLVRGGPGTGKSLVGLHVIAKFVEHRLTESLFDTAKRPRFGVLTYTNTLVGFNASLVEHVCNSADNAVEVDCQTVDKIVRVLAQNALGRRPQPRSLAEVQGWMHAQVLPKLGLDARQLIDRLGLPYVVEEIEKVIHDNDIQTRKEYLDYARRGRQIQLHKPEREIVWSIFETYQALRERYCIDSWEFMRKTALHELLGDPDYPRYNALFVDEVQDFPLTVRRLILNLVHNRRHLVLTEDTAQSIYVYPPHWKQVDDSLDFRGRSFVFRRNYRTTKEIYHAIEVLRLDSDEETAILAPVPQFSGPKPVWLEASRDGQVAVVADVIRILNRIHALGNVGVIVRTNEDERRYVTELRRLGIKAVVVDRANRINLGSDAVHVITAHSAKGIEFPAVVVPEVSDWNYPGAVEEGVPEGVRKEQEDSAKRLLYVALSRACRHLVLVTDARDPSRFISELDPDQWEHSI